MSTITTRAGKGSPLTNTELDANFENLNTDKLESGDNVSELTNDAGYVVDGTDATLSSLQLTGGTGTQGTLSWNTDEETLDLIQNGSTLQLGQETQLHVTKHGSAANIADGEAVVAVGTTGGSGKILVCKASVSEFNTCTGQSVTEIPAKYVIGLATEAITNNGKVTNFGKINDVTGATYTQGAVYYVDESTGGLTATAPTSGLVMPIAFAINSDTLMVRTTPINELLIEQGAEAYGWGDHALEGYITDYTVTESDVTAHQAALSITESQISDLSHYADSDVDTHLNTSTAATDQLLAWSGTDYSWVDAPSGGGTPDLYAENYDGTSTLPSATGTNAVAIGSQTEAAGSESFAAGFNATATAYRALAVGHGANAGNTSVALGTSANASGAEGNALGRAATASGSESAAIGHSSVATNTRSTALTRSYASGTDSLAAAIANNTSTYGAQGANSIAIGNQAKATGLYGTAIGRNAIASDAYATALGYNSNASNSSAIAIGDADASGASSMAFGTGAAASASSSIAFGIGAQANSAFSMALGARTNVNSIRGKYAWSGYSISGNNDGASQTGTMVLAVNTTDATSTALTTYASASTTNQLILPNNSAYAFSGTIIARQQAASGSDFAAWEIKGGAVRDANAASTSLGSYNINVLSKSTGASAWDIALSADTTNGGVAITVTGAAATNIRWVATVNTSEVIYA